MGHGVVLKLTVTHRQSNSGVMVTDAESYPYRCQCGQQWMDCRTLVEHIREIRDREQQS